jgi:lysophospholipase L1-like esterase
MTSVAAASPTLRRRTALLAAALLAVAGLALASVAGPAEAAPSSVSFAKPDKPPGGGGNGGGKPGSGGGGGTTELEYAAVGDSFAAGTGASPYIETSCYTSTKSYPKLLDADANLRLVAFPACSGASTSTVKSSQVPAIPVTAARVTLTAGGNDVGFASIMTNCFLLLNSSCESRIINAETLVADGTVATNIATTVQAITARAPGARVVVTGYPLLFHEPSSYRWAQRVNQGTVQLNAAIKSAAEANGAVFVDVTAPFAGHGIGSSSPWINGGGFSAGAFHPNATGYAAYATALRAVPVP